MSITSALNNAISGLDVSGRGLDVVAGNIANAETEGFTRKTLVQSDRIVNNRVAGAQVISVDRALNEQTQTQLRTFGGINVNNQIVSDVLGRLDTAFGEPGSAAALDTAFNAALSSLDALSATPESFPVQVQAVSDLRNFTGILNNLSDEIQNLRKEADTEISATVDQANAALQGIEEINARIIGSTTNTSDPVSLLDQRDRLVDELAQIVDIDVTNLPNNGIQIRTTSGVTLFDNLPLEFSFEQASAVTPAATLENGGLSTILVGSANGDFSVDLFANNGARQGALAAYGELRDTVLVEVQAQLDEFAAQLSLAVSNTTVSSSPVADGLAVDTTGIAAGNTVSLNLTDNVGTPQTVTLVQVSDPNQLPVAQTFTANPNDVVIGVDFSSPTAIADLQTQLDTLVPGNGVTVANTGASLEFTATIPASVDGLSASITNTSFTNGFSLPLFQDSSNGSIFTNALGQDGTNIAGFAGRIEVSDAVIDDPSLLSQFSGSTNNAGDSGRVDFILDQVRSENRTYSPTTGLGSSVRPLEATAADYLQTIISSQGQRASASQRDAEASQVSFNNVQDRIQAESSVNIDTEIARLIELEQAFQANARILTSVQELIDTLFAAFR